MPVFSGCTISSVYDVVKTLVLLRLNISLIPAEIFIKNQEKISLSSVFIFCGEWLRYAAEFDGY